MGIATGTFTFRYNDIINPLYSENQIKASVDLATEKLEEPLVNYVDSIDIDIHLFGNAGDVIKTKIDGETRFLQRKDGKAYILKTE